MNQRKAIHLIAPDSDSSNAPVSAYRPYTRALLRRYIRVAVDVGRLPSILGGLCFRARVSSYKLRTFEDAVIFVHDMERAFDRIEHRWMEIIAGVSLLDYSIPEAALRLGITVQRAERRYASALDALSAVLLEVGMLQPLLNHTQSGDSETGTSLPPRKPPASVAAADQAPVHHPCSSKQ
jgi:hypothetical protein